MTVPVKRRPLGQLLQRPPRYGVNAAAVPLALGVPTYIRITDIDDSGRFSPDPKVGVSHPGASNYQLGAGELVFARTGASVGKSYLYDAADGELVYAGFLINIAPDPKRLNPKYFALFAQSKEYWDWIARTSIRSGQPGVNGREYAELPIPLPDIKTQDAIAGATTDVDGLISVLGRLIAKKQAIKQGVMQQLLTGITRLPGYHGEWGDVDLREIATVTMGQSPSGATYNAVGSGLPLIQGNADIRGRKTLDRVWTNRPTKVCAAGDVILTVRAPVGFTAYASKEACLGRGVCGLSAKEDNQFLFHALTFAEPNWAVYGQGSTFAAVNAMEVRSFRIGWPWDKAERTAIARVLNAVDVEISTLQRRLAKAKDIKQGMMQELLTGRTRLPVSAGG